jgi:predicted RNase H-like nuclease
MHESWLVGVDGSAAGWVAAFVRPEGEEVRVRVVPRFADVPDAPEAPNIVAVDVPIGLPERILPGGRGPEAAVRKLLGPLRRSVFPIPSRQALYAEIGPFPDQCSRYAAHQRACAIAEATSDPPKRITIQAFGIFEKIREVDALLRSDLPLIERVFETHPEVAFWRLNGNRALDEPKKVKGVPYGPGLALRRGLLIEAGFPRACVEAAPPRGARADDLLDALACAAIARRIFAGTAEPFPPAPQSDAFGLQIAIWA